MRFTAEFLTQCKHVNECVDDLGTIGNNFFLWGGPDILDFVFQAHTQHALKISLGAS
jgi:hypothetical protein